MRRRVLTWSLATATVAAVVASTGLWTTSHRALDGAADASTTSATRTVSVIRADIAARDLEAGTIGYAGDWQLANPAPGGVLTAVPAPGTVILRGQPLYEVDGHPVRLLYGARPVWREFTLGMADGPDVHQLETNLVALGHGAGVSVDDHFSPATAVAIRRWQATLDMARTGTLILGDVLFTPGPTRVTRAATLGNRIAPDQNALEATSTARVVTVDLPTSQQTAVSVGGSVAVTPPIGPPQPGTVTAVGRVAHTAQPGTQDGPQQPTITVTITLDHPDAAAGLDQAPVEVAIITSEHKGVLAVPVTALVAASSGGYQVVVDQPGGSHRIDVQPGILDEVTNLIEVSGTALAPGQKVEVPTS